MEWGYNVVEMQEYVEEELEPLFEDADANGDGVLDLDEYKAFEAATYAWKIDEFDYAVEFDDATMEAWYAAIDTLGSDDGVTWSDLVRTGEIGDLLNEM